MSWRDDPNIQAALKERQPEDIMVLDCPACCATSYYGQGSHFTCRECGASYAALVEEEIEDHEGGPYVLCSEARTVGDLMDAESDAEMNPPY